MYYKGAEIKKELGVIINFSFNSLKSKAKVLYRTPYLPTSTILEFA